MLLIYENKGSNLGKLKLPEAINYNFAKEFPE